MRSSLNLCVNIAARPHIWASIHVAARKHVPAEGMHRVLDAHPSARARARIHESVKSQGLGLMYAQTRLKLTRILKILNEPILKYEYSLI